MPNTIALVDDDRNSLTSVSMALEAEGFAVRCFSDGTEALKGLSAQPVDIAVLDIKMPRMDGMELLGQLRRHSHIPIIFLTSKDDEVDELLGLRMGADDYIRKPFSQRLLIERIRALIRRGELAREREDPHGEPVIVRGQLTLDPARHLCTWREQHVELTVTEFLILKSLGFERHRHRGQDIAVVIDECNRTGHGQVPRCPGMPPRPSARPEKFVLRLNMAAARQTERGFESCRNR